MSTNPPSLPSIQAALLRGANLNVRFARGWYVATLDQSTRPYRVEASFDDVGKALACVEESLRNHRTVGVGDEGTGRSKA